MPYAITPLRRTILDWGKVGARNRKQAVEMGSIKLNNYDKNGLKIPKIK